MSNLRLPFIERSWVEHTHTAHSTHTHTHTQLQELSRAKTLLGHKIRTRLWITDSILLISKAAGSNLVLSSFFAFVNFLQSSIGRLYSLVAVLSVLLSFKADLTKR